MTTEPSSSGSSSSSSSFSRTRLSPLANTSSTKALSAPFRSISRSNFPPRARFTLPISRDLPAPVSPVRIFRPLPNSTSVSSIRARFFTCKLCSISFLLSGFSLQAVCRGLPGTARPALRKTHLLRHHAHHAASRPCIPGNLFREGFPLPGGEPVPGLPQGIMP